MLSTQCLFLGPCSSTSAPWSSTLLLNRDLRLLVLRDLSKQLFTIWVELSSTEVWRLAVRGVEEPESSSCSSICTVWICVVEWVVFSSAVFLKSQSHSSESLAHFIWTSLSYLIAECSSMKGSLIPVFSILLKARAAGWCRTARLLRPERRHPPPFPCCLVCLLLTPASVFNRSESSELPSYGSKNYNHEHTFMKP